jgi:transcription antitermination factor NusG
MNRNWYAVYTKPQSERKVAALLQKRKIESFCPHNRVITGYGSKKKMVYQPLFPTFVFVYITETEMSEVRRTGDVINFVYWLGKPAIIKTPEIENIAHFNGLYCNIKVERSPVNSVGMVHITNEPGLRTVSGFVNSKTTKIKLTLPSLGFTMFAETENEVLSVAELQPQVSEALV